MIRYASEVVFDVESFRECVESEKYKQEIQRESKDAAAKGIRGTPAFVIGKSTPNGVEGELILGAIPYGQLEKRLEGRLR